MTEEANQEGMFIDWGDDFGEIKEAVCVQTGAYDLTIAKVTPNFESRNIGVLIRIDDPPAGVDDVSPIFHNVSLPKDDDDAEKRRTKGLFTKRFLHLFKIPYQAESPNFNLNDFLGHSATKVSVELGSYKGRPTNNIVLPELPDEDAAGYSGSKRKRG